MERFWDERAEENAYFFVDNRLDYRTPDLERFWALGESDLETFLDALGVTLASSDRVVEVGCGVGRLTRAIALRVDQVIGVDISREMLARARQNLNRQSNIELVHGDGTSLAGIGDASADACLSHVVFQHIPEPAIVMGYVREMARVLRPGGWAGFQVSNDPKVHRPGRRGAVSGLLGRLSRGPGGMDHPAWLGSAVDLDELESVARGAGMALERVDGRGTQFCLVLARRAA
jgi:SAM-dependent methyltransferase